MDPNETLRRIRELVRAIQHGEAADGDAPTDLADAVQDLDGWLTQGGFPPDAWAGPGVGIPPDVEPDDGNWKGGPIG